MSAYRTPGEVSDSHVLTTPIIIETPAPPTRERLVLVPPDACTPVFEDGRRVGLSVRTPHARDATPDDLERGGYERLGPEVLRVSAAEWRELKLRAEGREAHGEPGTLAHLRNDLRDAISRAEAAEGLLIQRETELRLAREDGAAVERQMREAARAADASFVRANRAEMRAEKAERERDEARELVHGLGVQRDTLRAELAAVSKTLLEAGCGSVLPLAERVAMLVDERAGLRGALHEAKEFARVLEVERGASREECSAQIARAVRAERERDPERILDDLDTLLAENARLRAVAEAARDACNIALNDAGPEAFATIADLRKALAALEAP